MAISSSVSRQSAAKPGATTSISPSCDHYGARLPLTLREEVERLTPPLVAAAGTQIDAKRIGVVVHPRAGDGVPPAFFFTAPEEPNSLNGDQVHWN
jgi:hypothetical protein